MEMTYTMIKATCMCSFQSELVMQLTTNLRQMRSEPWAQALLDGNSNHSIFFANSVFVLSKTKTFPLFNQTCNVFRSSSPLRPFFAWFLFYVPSYSKASPHTWYLVWPFRRNPWFCLSLSKLFGPGRPHNVFTSPLEFGTEPSHFKKHLLWILLLQLTKMNSVSLFLFYTTIFSLDEIKLRSGSQSYRLGKVHDPC